MRPDLSAIACTLVLPLIVVGILAWRITLLRIGNRRKRTYLQALHRKYRQ